jgi:hypothetical protein
MRKRPEPINTRSRSKSPSPMFMSRSVLPRRVSETKQVTQPIHKASETKPKIKILSSSGELVEPTTPPGIPPYISRIIKRPVIKISKII